MQGPIVSANGFRMEPFSRKRRRSFEDESEDLHRRLKKWKQKKNWWKSIKCFERLSFLRTKKNCAKVLNREIILKNIKSSDSFSGL